jgi:diacylglycerol kinase (ATP)
MPSRRRPRRVVSQWPDPVPTSLELYLVRHAVAAERGPDYPDDAQRPLTPEGVSRWRRSVAGLREFGLILDLVLASPLVRARETAELLAAGLKPKPRLVECDALAAGRKTAEVLAVIAKYAAAPRPPTPIALVGHEPDLGGTAPRRQGRRRVQEGRRLPDRPRSGDARRSRRAAVAAAAAGAAGPGSVKSALVVINPISGAGRRDGGGAAEVEVARAALAAGGFEATVVVTTGPGHASAAATRACAEGSALVVAWGGDGTMNEVARVLAFGPIPLALVPAGSGNGLARDLGVPRDPRAALAVAIGGRPWRIDAGAVNGALFFNVAGLGLDARIAHAFAANTGRRGLRRYVQLAVRELLRYRARRYDIDWSAGRASTRALFVALANSRQYGGHGRIAPRAVLDDGRLDLVVVGDLPLWRVVRRLPGFFRGTLHPDDDVAMQSFTNARIATDGPWELHVDGEPSSGSGAVEVAVRPGALTVIAPLDSSTPRAATY